MVHPSENRRASKQETNLFAAFLRVIWMFLGPCAAGFTVIFIAAYADGLSRLDLGPSLGVFSALVARWADITYFDGETAEGEPATMQHFRAYAVKLVLSIGIAWVLAHLVRLV